MAEKLTVEIDLDDLLLKKKLSDTETAAKKTGDSIGEKLSKGFERLTSNIFSFKGALVGVGSALAGAFAVGKLIDAAKGQEDAVSKMNIALQNAGTYSKAASEDFQRFASEMQKITVVGDETTLHLLSLARNFTHSNDEAKKLTEAAIRLSAATGENLETSVEQLGRSLSGITRHLTQILPAMRGVGEESLKAGAALDFVLQRFSNAGKVLTFGDAIKQFNNIFGDLLETLGNIIIKSPELIAVIKFVSERLLAVTDSINKFGETQNIIGNLITKLISFGMIVNQYVVAPVELAVHVVESLFKSLQLLFQSIFGGFWELTGVIADIAAKFGLENNAIVTGFQSARDIVRQTTEQIASDTKTAWANVFDFDVAGNTQIFLEDLNATVEGARLAANVAGKTLGFEFNNGFNVAFEESKTQVRASVGAALGVITEVLEAHLKESAKKIQDFKNQVSSMIKSALVNVISQGMQAIGAALVQGGNAFSNFGNVVLGILGDIAIQLGTFIISSAKALGALGQAMLNPITAPAAAIALGALLIIIGGALKAMANKPTGALPTTAAGTVPVTPTTDTGLPINNETPYADIVEEKKKTEVIVNIHGNVLDRRQTGLEIVDIINEAVGSGGGVIMARA